MALSQLPRLLGPCARGPDSRTEGWGAGISRSLLFHPIGRWPGSLLPCAQQGRFQGAVTSWSRTPPCPSTSPGVKGQGCPAF